DAWRVDALAGEEEGIVGILAGAEGELEGCQVALAVCIGKGAREAQHVACRQAGLEIARVVGIGVAGTERDSGEAFFAKVLAVKTIAPDEDVALAYCPVRHLFVA